MDRKRRNTSSPESDAPPPKRSRNSPMDYEEEYSSDEDSQASTEEQRTDPTYGQKGAFPGLGGEDDEELFYGPASDGIEYLRMVRSEAKGVPRLLVAPALEQTSPTSDVHAFGGGFFDNDEAYIAVSTSEPQRPNDDEADAQDEYYKSLLLRFDLVSATLRCTPPLKAVNDLPSSCVISYPRDSKKARNSWRKTILTTEPSMVQLACTDMDSVLGVVTLLADTLARVLKKRDLAQIKNIAAWIWGCFGRCSEVGELGSEEVAELREMGKVAVAALVGIRDGIDVHAGYEQDGANETDDEECDPAARPPSHHYPAATTTGTRSSLDNPVSANGKGKFTTGSGNNSADELQRAKERLQSLVSDEPEAEEDEHDSDAVSAGKIPDDFDTQSRALLDMIITIIGDRYGQRDLLEFRDIWEQDPL